MICPKCKEQGKKSKVYGGMAMVTCAYFAPYYDEDGKFHNHDGNRRTSTYTCSNNHKITIVGTGKCGSCDWGHNSDKVTVEDIAAQVININGNSGLIKLNND